MCCWPCRRLKPYTAKADPQAATKANEKRNIIMHVAESLQPEQSSYKAISTVHSAILLSSIVIANCFCSACICLCLWAFSKIGKNERQLGIPREFQCLTTNNYQLPVAPPPVDLRPEDSLDLAPEALVTSTAPPILQSKKSHGSTRSRALTGVEVAERSSKCQCKCRVQKAPMNWEP